MSASAPIQWRKIILVAVLSAVIALALICVGVWVLGQNPGGILDKTCPSNMVNCLARSSTGNIISDFITGIVAAFVCAFAWGIVCAMKIALYAVIIYLPLAAIVSIILVNMLVQQRRWIHTILALVLSIPFAIGLGLLISRIMK